MKSTDQFKKTIKAYLDQRAEEDELFARSYAKEGKNIDDCITYILNTAYKSGYNGFADEEVFCMAIHYYDEDDLEIGSPISARVVVNHTIEITEEDREAARKAAIERLQEEAYNELRKKPVKKPAKSKKEPVVEQQQIAFF